MYPEHEKLMAISDQTQAIGEFLDYSPYVLTEWVEYEFGGAYLPVSKSINTILAEYFGIDLNKIEDEKRQMLEETRNMR